MRARNVVILVVLAVVAVGLGWQFGTRTEPNGRKEIAAGTLVFPGLAARLQAVTKVEILHQGQHLVLTQANGKWGIADRGGYPVQQDKLRELLTGLTELRITEPRTADPTQFARLGVEDPQPATANSNLLRLIDADGKTIAELIVGHRRVRTQGNVPETIYIRHPGEDQSYLAEGRMPVDADPQLWFNRDIANVDGKKVTAVVVHRGDSELDFKRDGDKFVLTAPAEHPKLDDYRVEDVARSLETLTLTDVKPAAQEPGEKIGTASITTSDPMTVTVTVFKAGNDIWTQYAAVGDGAGKDAAAAMQARVGPWAYQVGSWKEKSFVPRLEDLKADEPEKPAATGGSRHPGAATLKRDYPDRPIVGIGVVMLRRTAAGPEVLLVQRAKPPNAGSWSLPGGAQELGETAEAAARRELAEETGLDVGPLLLAANVDSIHRDADGRIAYHYTIIDFAGLWVGGEAVAGHDAAAVAWAPLDGLDRFELWKEAHRVIAIARRLLDC